MNLLINALILYTIPVLLSMSWLFVGTLVRSISPLALVGARVLVATLFLLPLTGIRAAQRPWPREKCWEWWRVNFVLSITGRVLYYYFSAQALTSITPFEAVLLSTLLPIILIVLEAALGGRFSNAWVSVFAALAVASSISTLFLETPGAFPQFKIGYLEMGVAVAFYAIHLVIYKRRVKDRSPVNPLFAQFLIATVILLPLDLPGVGKLLTFGATLWPQLLMYTLVCTLLPFVLVHYALKRTSSFVVGSVSVLSPLFAFLLKGIYTHDPIPLSFVGMSAVSCMLIFLTIALDARVTLAATRQRA